MHMYKIIEPTALTRSGKCMCGLAELLWRLLRRLCVNWLAHCRRLIRLYTFFWRRWRRYQVEEQSEREEQQRRFFAKSMDIYCVLERWAPVAIRSALNQGRRGVDALNGPALQKYISQARPMNPIDSMRPYLQYLATFYILPHRYII